MRSPPASPPRTSRPRTGAALRVGGLVILVGVLLARIELESIPRDWRPLSPLLLGGWLALLLVLFGFSAWLRMAR